MKPIAVGLLITALLISIAANALLYTRYSSNRPLLTMGDTVVSRKEYRDALDSQHGKAVLQKIVLAKLVEREASKMSLAPSSADVDERIKQMERATPELVHRAQQDATSLYIMRRDAATDVSLERLRLNGVSVNDAEVVRYFRAHPEQFMRPMEVKTTAVIASNSTDASTAASLLRQGIKPYVIAQQRGLRVVGVGGVELDTSGLKPAEVAKLQSAMGSMKQGEVATAGIGKNFLIFQLQRRTMRTAPSLESVKADAERLAKLAKAPTPSDVLVRLYQSANPVFEANQYAEYFRELEEAIIASPKSSLPTKVSQLSGTASR